MTRRRIRTEPITETESGHLTEFLYDDYENDGVLVCAAHGGRVEPGTAELAVELAARHPDATCWATFGFDDEVGAYERWHPPSKSFDPDEYPLLSVIADRGFESVLSVHGLGDDEVLVGGRVDRAVKAAVADRLDAALSTPARPVSDGDYGGTHPENFVNWLAADGAGLQVELGETARGSEAEAVLEVLVDVLRDGQVMPER
ncbi:MAG: poly-gamma-glutamate hydrolase family protein [Haloarculaceae archaeon]